MATALKQSHDNGWTRSLDAAAKRQPDHLVDHLLNYLSEKPGKKSGQRTRTIKIERTTKK